MGDGEALLAAVLERPEDDAPRLVYADWLDEQGQTGRAEYIRAMVRFPIFIRASVTAEPVRYDAEAEDIACDPAWTVRGRRPLSEAEVEWTLKMLPRPRAWGIVEGTRAVIRRGFVESVTADTIGWHTWCYAFRSQPLTRVRLTDAPAPDCRGPRDFRWYESTNRTGPGYPQPFLARRLTGGSECTSPDRFCVGRSYPSLSAAAAALSRAAIACCRG